MQEAPAIRNILADELFNERVRTFREFLDNDYGENIYRDKILKMILAGNKRLIVNTKHIRSFNQEYAAGLLSEPVDFLPAFDKALRDVIASVGNANADANTLYSIGLEGSFGDNNISPRNLSSYQLGKLICIEGIVSRCSLVRPKVAKSVHYCEATQMFHTREYRDQTNLGHAMPTGSTYPKEDENGNPLTTEFGLSTYRGTQTISIQEMPERAPPGQLPRPVDVILDHDLSDLCKPGDRVQIIGVYRSMGKHAASSNALFKTIILANNIKQLGKTINKFELSDANCDEIKHIASKRKDIFEVLSKSLAPSIYGHEYIKKAVLLQMLGGVEKNLDNGTHIRGDINILMIGDPSTAKSQMLRFILNIAPLAIATTGRGSSGVGLTAAVTTDRDTGERKLEAGAMVLADRGVVCIDEFDKMSDVDRVAIHEVMEQQTVTIAKAGIHTSLNARCSVIAAANPVMGQYVDTKEPSKNINLPDSLLSRFDLLFVVLDNLEDEHNRRIANHVVRLHRFISPGHEEGVPVDEDNCLSFNTYTSAQMNDTEGTVNVGIYEKYNQLLHFGHTKPKKSRKKASKSTVPDDCVDLFTIAFIRKYIQYAKANVSPTLTKEASAMISNQYSELRSWEDGRERKYRVMPITPRTLETLIRLSTAHAKARLSPLVEESDVEVAIELLEYALYKEVKVKASKRAKIEKPYDSSDSDSDDSDEGKYERTPNERARRVSNKPAATDSMDLDDDDVDNEVAMKNLNLTTTGFEASQSNSAQDINLSGLISNSGSSSQRASSSRSSLPSNPQRIKNFERVLNECRVAKSNAQDISLSDLKAHLSSTDFQEEEILSHLRQMSIENRIWFREDENEIMFM